MYSKKQILHTYYKLTLQRKKEKETNLVCECSLSLSKEESFYESVHVIYQVRGL